MLAAKHCAMLFSSEAINVTIKQNRYSPTYSKIKVMFEGFTNFLPFATFLIAFVVDSASVTFVECRGFFALQRDVIHDIFHDVIIRIINYTNQMNG